MEGLDVTPAFWQGRRVLVTGHTGFKGAWLAFWLRQMGAEVAGFARDPDGEPSLWPLLGLDDVGDHRGDLRDPAALGRVFAAFSPQIVFHLAAQALVRASYRDPVETFETNVIGTVRLLEAVRACPGVQAVVVATSDKAYENTGKADGYGEDDPMGGHDPYSASKGAAEIAVSAMRRSFFAPDRADGHPARVASVRAGNVIGGGDWGAERLVPDIVRGCLGPAGEVVLRAPGAVRPWQHVLDALRGYLMAAERLADPLAAPPAWAWNFGPRPEATQPVRAVAEALVAALGRGAIRIAPAGPALHEASLLTLDPGRAGRTLGWYPGLDFQTTIAMTSDWYGRWSRGAPAAGLCAEQIAHFMDRVSAGDQGADTHCTGQSR